MSANYHVVARPEHDLISMTLSGFFGPSDVAGFDAARRLAHARLRCAPNRHDTLVDVRNLKLQAQDVVETFREILAEPSTRSRRLAFVTGTSAIRMQLRRVIDRDAIRCFAEMPAAEAWLGLPSAGMALAG